MYMSTINMVGYVKTLQWLHFPAFTAYGPYLKKK